MRDIHTRATYSAPLGWSEDSSNAYNRLLDLRVDNFPCQSFTNCRLPSSGHVLSAIVVLQSSSTKEHKAALTPDLCFGLVAHGRLTKLDTNSSDNNLI